MISSLPYVSIVMPTLNEVRYLERAVTSLSENGYPVEKLEFILVDGGSSDGTLEVAERLINQGNNIRLLSNEMKTTPFALNIGIEAATHKIILRADAHAIYSKDYISKSVALLESGAGDNIGGTVTSIKSDTALSELLAYVLNSSLGNGGAGYRKATEGKLVDTVWCGCWYKSTLIQVGMFDVNWVNNQDAELNARLISAGFRVFSDPEIQASLVVRSTLREFIRQYFRYGRGRYRTLYRHPHILRFRQVIPLFAVAVLLAFFLAAPLLAASAFLFCAITLAFLFRVKKPGFSSLPILMQLSVFPLVVVMNICWVTGMVIQLVSQLLPMKRDF
ncbi:MAG: succinoglycan biosynthesis protein ExoA [Arenicella sp.]